MKRHMAVLVLSLSAAALFAGGFLERMGGRVVGNQDFQTRDVDVGEFTAIEVGGGIALEVQKGAATAVRVRAESNILRYVQLSVSGSRLRIRMEPGPSLSTHGVTVSVSMESLEALDASGGARARLGPEVAALSFRATVSGGASLKGSLRADSARLEASGGAEIELEGRCGRLDLDASGGGRLLIEGLEATSAVVSLSGGALARVNAGDSVTVDVSGGARLAYRGSPRLELKGVSGGASVERI